MALCALTRATLAAPTAIGPACLARGTPCFCTRS